MTSTTTSSAPASVPDFIPRGEHLRMLFDAGVLTVLIDRPKVRNAMSVQTVTELEAVFDAVASRREVRLIVLRGSGGHFCAGGDIKDMAGARAQTPSEGQADALAVVNRRFGAMITTVDRAPQPVVAACEGAVLGGGFGLACVADITLATADAKFGLPETGLGIPPAQIAPFLVKRLGLSQARRLAVTGGRFDGHTAKAIGLAHEVVADAAGLDAAIAVVAKQVLRCAPEAIATTKRLMLDVGAVPHEALLDRAADEFASAARGAEGIEGMTAFLQKRTPQWGSTTGEA